MTISPTMKILYGPPGTGKTWLAAREAVKAVLPEKFQEWKDGKLSDEELLAVHEKLVLNGFVKWVTFHPSYSYEDFVEGFRPTLNPETKTIVFEVKKGPFREICDTASGTTDVFGPKAGAEIKSVNDKKDYTIAEESEQGWLIVVRPEREDGVGKEQKKFVPRDLIRRAYEAGLEPKAFSIPGKTMVDPATVGLEGEPMKGSDLRRIVAERLGISSSDLANGAHMAAVLKYIKENEDAEIHSSAPACLVIDEINRADLSRVFGELITLLEVDKRVGATEERRVQLPYSGEKRFGVPSTLSIIGTMNTADRSLAAVDLALRRRFEFVAVYPDPALCPDAYGGLDVRSALDRLNHRVAALLSKEHQVGHAELMDARLEKVRQNKGWEADDSGRARAVASVWRNKIVPLLLEYFRDDWRLSAAALGCEVGSYDGSLFQELSVDDVAQLVDSIIDLGDGQSFALPTWWDPESVEWDEQKFRSAFLKIYA